jgi:hypothetical protein
LHRESDEAFERGQVGLGRAKALRAIDAYGRALREQTRESAPLQWAATEDNLGGVLLTLGGWDAGTGYLSQAVIAFQAALQERTRERVPLQWAATQSNRAPTPK